MERHALRLLTILLYSLVAGCADRAPEVPARTVVDSAQSPATAPVPEFAAPAFEEGRTLDTIVKVDDGRVVAVASIQRDSTTPAFARADRVELFAWSGKEREFLRVDQQALHWARSYRVLPPGAGRTAPVLLVFTDGGGNDPIASRGATMMTLRTPVPLAQSLSHGAPQTVAGGDTLLLLTRARFTPPLARLHEGYEYVDGIFEMVGDTLRDARADAGATIVQGQYRTALEGYHQAMKTYGGYRYRPSLVIADTAVADSAMTEAVGGAPPEPSPLCLPAAAMLIALERAEESEERTSFWRRERPKLRTMLSPVELAALDSLARLHRAH